MHFFKHCTYSFYIILRIIINEKIDFGYFSLFVNDNNENMSIVTFGMGTYETCYNVQSIYTNYTRYIN